MTTPTTRSVLNARIAANAGKVKTSSKQRRALLAKRIKTNLVRGLTVATVQALYKKHMNISVTSFVARLDLEFLVGKALAFSNTVGRYFPASVASLHGAFVGFRPEPTQPPVETNPEYLSTVEREARQHPEVTQRCIIHIIQNVLVIEYDGCLFTSYREAQEFLNAERNGVSQLALGA